MAGNGLNFPMQKLTMSVTEVMVIDTAASDSVLANLSGTSMVTGVRRQAANITNVSSIPMPEKRSADDINARETRLLSAYCTYIIQYN
jgi:hypothetical protein